MIKGFNHDLIDFLLDRQKISIESNVLDFGYGDGYLLSKLNCKKTGIEKGDTLVVDDFDYIFMLDVIEHLHIVQVQMYFDYFKRFLKSNGKIFISTPNINNLYQNISFWDEETHVRPYTIQAMENLCSKNGFQLSVIPFHHFKNPLKIFINTVLGLNWYNKNIFELVKE